MTARAPLVCRWADVAIGGIIINLGVLVTAPIARPDLDLLQRSLSYYAVGPWGALQVAGFIAFGVAALALASALTRVRFDSRWIRVSSPLLVVSAIGGLGLIWYPMGAPGPATPLGDAHQTAGTISGVALLAASLAFAIGVRLDRVWRALFVPAVVAFGAALAGAVLTQAAIWWPDMGIPMGATMRLLVIPLVLLWGFVSLRLRRRCLTNASPDYSWRR
jgi:hypothetical protein